MLSQEAFPTHDDQRSQTLRPLEPSSWIESHPRPAQNLEGRLEDNRRLHVHNRDPLPRPSPPVKAQPHGPPGRSAAEALRVARLGESTAPQVSTPLALGKGTEQQVVEPIQHRGERLGAPDIRGEVEHRLLSERARHLRYLVAKLRSREDAEDTLQDFTIRALKGAGRVRLDRIDAWLNVSLRNALFDRYRRDSSRRRLSEAAAAEPTADAEPDVIEDVSSGCLSASIGELKPAYATVLRRVDLEEASLGDLARELKLTTNNTAVRLHRARAVLRRLMHVRCTACPAPCLLAAQFIARSAA